MEVNVIILCLLRGIILKKPVIKISLLVIAIMISFMLGKLYGINGEMYRNKVHYLNEMDWAIERTIISIDALEKVKHNKDKTNEIEDFYQTVSENFDYISVICDEARYYMINIENRHIIDELERAFSLIEESIKEGLNLNGQKICDGFFEDRVISENEISFLKNIKKNLKDIQNGIYNSNEKKVNEDMTMYELEKINRDFAWRYGNVTEIINQGLKN